MTSEGRTQAPTARRRQLAREGGQAAHSPELSASAGLLASSAALAVWGEGLASSLLGLVREPLTTAVPFAVEAAEVVARIRHAAVGVAGPLLAIFGAAAAGALAAHQAQVRGLWAPGLLAPDPSRLWATGQGGGLVSRAGRGLWSVAKASVVVAVAAWVVRSGWAEFPRLSALDTPELAASCGRALARLALTLAGATLALGLVDFGLQWHRLETLLRLTPDEQREEIRSMEGDPSLRAQRRRIARSWRGGHDEILAGASLLLTGPSGLTVVLGGGLPPRRVSVRSILNGPAGLRLRRDADPEKFPRVEAPDLALRLARRRPPGLPPSPELLEEIVGLWPKTARNLDS